MTATFEEQPTEEDRFTLKGVTGVEFPGSRPFRGGRGDRVRVVLEGVVEAVFYDESGSKSRRELKIRVDDVVRVVRKV